MPVLVAWSEGCEIEVRDAGTNDRWERPRISTLGGDGGDCDFDNEKFEWRVKPRLREFWVVCDSGGFPMAVHSAKPQPPYGVHIIHCLEVVE